MIVSDLAGLHPHSVRLAAWGLVRARGEDAAAFLHSQLTQDIAGLPAGEARLAGWCSPKGRLLATFVVWRAAADEFLLACSADVLANALKRLSMFVLRAKCKLSDASSELHVWGLVDPEAGGMPLGVSAMVRWPDETWRTNVTVEGTLVRLDDVAAARRGLWIASADSAPPLPGRDDPAAWNWLEVQSAVPRIVARTADAFVPQMVNFELVGGVHFQKGCYPGQEIVARSQYRGTVKRRMFLAASSVGAEPGAEVYAQSDPSQPAGLVVLAAARPDDAMATPGDAAREGAPAPSAAPYALLVEAKRELADGAPLRLGSAAGPALARQPLPYALPAEAA